MTNLVASAAALADLPRPVAATTGRSDSGLEEPFAAALVNSGAAGSTAVALPRRLPHRPRPRP